MDSKIKSFFKSNSNTLFDGLKTMFKEFFKKETNKKQRANMWTFGRIIAPFIALIPSIIAALTGLISPLIISVGISGFGALTDFFDGRSARKHNSSSEFGKKLDQVADKVFSLVVGINVAIINPLYIIPIILEAGIGIVNLKYNFKYPTISNNSTRLGKIKEWPLMITLAFGFISKINLVTFLTSIGLISLTTILQYKTIKDYKKRREYEKNILNIDDRNYNPNIPINVLNNDLIKSLGKEICNDNIEKINKNKQRKLLLKELYTLKENLFYKEDDVRLTHSKNKILTKK